MFWLRGEILACRARGTNYRFKTNNNSICAYLKQKYFDDECISLRSVLNTESILKWLSKDS